MVLSLNKEQKQNCFSHLRGLLDARIAGAQEYFLNVGGVKTVRVLSCDPEAAPMIRHQLAWSLTSPVSKPDATLVLWRDTVDGEFHKRSLGLDIDDDGSGENLILALREDGGLRTFGEFSYENKTAFLTDGDTSYYCVESFEAEEWIKEGHLFVHWLYKVADTPASHLVHGACIGMGGSGVLMCARGQRGKSTLAVTAMLRGFEYVSDDYLILENSDEGLTASPIYSIITLSPRMYAALYDDLDRARFICNNARKDKYVFDISGYADALRRNYPIKACIFPEIDTSLSEAVIEPCTAAQKGRAITHLIHSTVMQMQVQGDASTVRKLIGMLQGLPFYSMRLCPDIFGNVETMRKFLLSCK
ncbi:MAG: hypothetical protein J5490_03560 [Bacteroidales bacterium]|nr:hypothetical protein [Bacteroidales bacterium]